MKIIIEVKNLTANQLRALKVYSKSATDFIGDIKAKDKTLPIESIGFQLQRIGQALEYITGELDNIEAND